MFLRPFGAGRYERQQFGFVGYRFVGFSHGMESLVSFCSGPAGRSPDQTTHEMVFSGKNYPLNTRCAMQILLAVQRSLRTARDGSGVKQRVG